MRNEVLLLSFHYNAQPYFFVKPDMHISCTIYSMMEKKTLKTDLGGR